METVPQNRPTTPPMSTRIRSYGTFVEVSGDFNDSFMVRVNWDGTVFLYNESDEGYTFMRSFTNVSHLMKDMPGFAIISPTNSNERYLPSFVPHIVTKVVKHHE